MIIKPELDMVHGVQAIIMVESHHNYLEQKYIIVQDYNDRGRNDGILKYGLSGGGMYTGEHHKIAVHREVTREEIGGLDLDIEDFKKFGCYQKLRSNGLPNDNHLYVVKLDYIPNKKTTHNKRSKRSF